MMSLPADFYKQLAKGLGCWRFGAGTAKFGGDTAAKTFGHFVSTIPSLATSPLKQRRNLIPNQILASESPRAHVLRRVFSMRSAATIFLLRPRS